MYLYLKVIKKRFTKNGECFLSDIDPPKCDKLACSPSGHPGSKWFMICDKNFNFTVPEK